MRSVCGLLIALSLVSVGAGSPAALAADVLPASGLVELLPVGDLPGDGATTAKVHALALYPSGAPMEGLKLKVEVQGGGVVDMVDLGRGVYEAVVTPPAVTAPQPLRLTVKGRTPDRAVIDASVVTTVRPATRGGIAVRANPDVVVLGQDATATVSFTVPQGPDAPGAADLLVRASAGQVSEIIDLGDGRFTARYTPPRVNYPHVAILTVADGRRPGAYQGYVAIPLHGKVEFPVTAEPGAAVILRLGDREFGPVIAGADGKASVPIVVPPGQAKAQMVSVLAGRRSEQELDLGLPEVRRLAVFPVAQGVPSDDARTVPVRVVVLRADGTPDAQAALDLSVTAGRLGRPVHLGDGVYEAPLTPPASDVRSALTVQAKVPGGVVQSDAAEVVLVPRFPAKVELLAEPTALSADGTGLRAFVKVRSPDGAGLSGQTVVVSAAGASLKGPVADLKGGDYRQDLSATAGTDVALTAVALPPASTSAVEHLLVLPSAVRMAPDGVTSSPVLVVATDAWGYPVAGVPVTLTVSAGEGALPSTVTTDARGIAEVYYTAGAAPGVAEIRATAGARTGAAAIVLAGLDVVPELPWSGTADQARVARAWAALRAAVVVERAGGAAAPVGVQPTAPAGGSLAAITVQSSPATVAPGGTVTLRIGAADAAGRGVGGARFDLLASQGARFGAVTDVGDGTYEATLSVPVDATGAVRVSVMDPAGATSAVLEVPVQGAPVAAGSPWGEGAVSTEPVVTLTPETASTTTPRRERVEPTIDRPFFRLRASALVSSYQYRQEPSAEPGALLPAPLAWGGEAGGGAVPLGVEAVVRAFVPKVPYLGFHGQFRWSRYQVDSDVFSEPAKDNLLATRVDVVPRLPIAVGQQELSFGARVGFRYDDFITFSGCTDPGCSVSYKPLGVAGLDAGLEIGLEVWKLYAVFAGSAGFAYGSQPYAANVDANLGWNITKNVLIDLGFGWQLRRAEMEGGTSGVVRGTLTDQQLLGTVGVGFSL